MFAAKELSKIGLGCVTFGREIDEESSNMMMDYAYEKSISFFDTAAAYGNGVSETIVGKWLSKHSSKKACTVVATKILPPYDAANIEKSVNESLTRLRTDSIDLLYLHRWDYTLERSGALEALNKLITSGKIQALGASNFTTEQLSNILSQQIKNDLKPFQFIQNNHNLAVSDVSFEFKQICLQHNIDIVTYSPLGAGFLTGKHTSGVQSGTRFDLLPGHQDVYFNERAYARLEKLQEVALSTGHTAAHLALSWALHQPGVASVLIGGRSTAHIDQGISAMAFNDPAIFASLEQT